MKKYYFLISSALLLILSIIGFSDNLFTDIGQKSNSDPKFIIHGLFCFAWFIILLIQTNYIRSGNYKAHKKLGVAGMVVALGVFVTTVYIFVVIYKGWDNMAFEARCNRFLMPSFAVMVWLGYLNRKKTEMHKRLMYVATLYMLGPIISRAMSHSFLDSLIPVSAEVTWDITLFGIWSSFFISLFIYDWTILKKIHKVTLLGFVWYCIILTLSMF